ncbi:MAG: hypothetical protein COT73_12285 [Bdellovibrio sp. CG10_big_fil_rev_8_21_14_0_10_47_8]|nr:MAG: hypothetical protein COT73_12285 [Bdellovibrio sp. CG10_big_fil_rev_8_21_14_0_10_47_8]
MATIPCDVDLSVPGTSDAPAGLTVGQVFLLHCKGEWPQGFDPKAMELRLDSQDQHKLKILDLQFVSKEEATLQVTSYRPGEHQLKAVQLVDAGRSVVLGDLSFTVQSVIDPKDPPKEPLGPQGPVGFHFPIWYWIVLVSVLLSVMAALIIKIRARAQKKKLLASMHLDQWASTPSAQFYQTLRRLQRAHVFLSGGEATPAQAQIVVDELQEAFRLYLARLYLIPTLAWGDKKILRDLKKNHSEVNEHFGEELRKALAELQRAQTDAAKGKSMTAKDCEQLLALLRKQVDHLEAFENSRKKSEGGR